MTYEDMQKQHEDLYIKEMNLYEVDGLKGLYIDGCIIIDKNLTNKEKACVCAEEVGHHLTSSGDILDQTKSSNRKQEHKARMIAYNIQVGLQGIVESFEAGCTNLYAMADHIDVPEEFLQEALDCYKNKYGLCTRLDNYVIYFEPLLGVMKMF